MSPSSECETPRNLRLRLESALQVLASGRARAAYGQEGLRALQQSLKEAEQRLALDFREVQESTVEHAAMYAKNPEVLGGMLHLVFCLDLVHQWVQSRDDQIKEMEQNLQKAQQSMVQCTSLMDQLSLDVRSCKESLAALERASRDATNPGGSARAQRAQAAQEELLRQNAELRAELESAKKAASLHVRRDATVTDAPVQTLLQKLEQLEPLLAAMPAGPGVELQEEACEAYGRLRGALLEAAAIPEVPSWPGDSGRSASSWSSRSEMPHAAAPCTDRWPRTQLEPVARPGAYQQRLGPHVPPLPRSGPFRPHSQH